MWCSTTYRNHPPFEVGYHEYYDKRCEEGALWLEDGAQSELLLTGGFKVKYAGKNGVY